MVRSITTERIPIKLWLDDIEEGAMQQARDIANLPFAARHVAIMPDAHQGFGMPIGGVLATRGVVVPNAVGVDIGCGMCSIKTSISTPPSSALGKIAEDIKRSIPVGFKHHRKPRPAGLLPPLENPLPVTEREYEKAAFQVGTLGGGNHFIELQKDPEGYLRVMVHSGSRNLGKQVADHYYREAVRINEKELRKKEIPGQLAGLLLDSDQGRLYIREMHYCVDFALANRKHMMDVVCEIIDSHFPGVTFSGFINIAHNYASREKHFGEQLMIHRKGATSAKKGEWGIIPGSQGSSSYIVKGKGNPESFSSCSHGAGRKMGRKQAQRTLDLIEEKGRLDKQGIIHSVISKKDLDEASGAYKDISMVMKLQEDLVEIVTELQPLAVIKG
jgi:tRNA-splicing ligase RtcB (3'-phosphate/5'-hydroxy nucleic acid ligase)